jgi:hypothetical protein
MAAGYWNCVPSLDGLKIEDPALPADVPLEGAAARLLRWEPGRRKAKAQDRDRDA